MSDLDLKLIGGSFMDTYLPPESVYLHRYFRSELGRVFVSYYFMFNELITIRSARFFLFNFVDHTGFYCSLQRLRYLLKRLQLILDAKKKADENFDFDLISKIKTGKYKFTKLNVGDIDEKEEEE